ncbi:transporter substrate-binding domain-containing protein [Afifella sp. H1R]|uniref:transporter substrate-binding domain-containing protein n=1 Tax=Afifella sp. H1R TaxID=2908841 RepID=UPI001F486AAF|nr:transporter substrate-binding domain-containing protein [Afifella sp. H1R]MCF1505948.1 transporter substrate-binding domain-containing protein [Afifella sp. H1R]
MMKAFWAAVAFTVLASQAAQAGEPSFVSDGKVAVCTSANFPPLTFKKDVGDTVPVGIDIEVADALAGTWNATTTYTTTEFAGLLPTLGSGRCGLIVSGIYINDERRQTYDGARYMKSATVIVKKAGNDAVEGPETLSGKSVALESGTYYQEERVDPLNKEFAAAGKPEIAVDTYPTQQAAYQQVLVGRADATLTEEAEGAYRVAAAPDQLAISYTWQSEFTYGIYMRRNPDDLAAVRAGLKKLREEGFFDALAKKYGLDPSVFDVDYDS